MQNTIKIGNIEFTQVPACSFGDYGGDGSVGLANINSLKDQFKDRFSISSMNEVHWSDQFIEDVNSGHIDMVILDGLYQSSQAYLRTPTDDEADDEYRSAFEDVMRALANYPVLDDEELAKVEMEWTDAAIADSVRDFRFSDEDADAIWSALDQAQAEELIRLMMEKTNTCAEMEYSSAFIPTSRLEDALEAYLLDLPRKHGVTLADGTFVAVPEFAPEISEEDELFANLPHTSTADYVAAYCTRAHLIN